MVAPASRVKKQSLGVSPLIRVSPLVARMGDERAGVEHQRVALPCYGAAQGRDGEPDIVGPPLLEQLPRELAQIVLPVEPSASTSAFLEHGTELVAGGAPGTAAAGGGLVLSRMNPARPTELPTRRCRHAADRRRGNPISTQQWRARRPSGRGPRGNVGDRGSWAHRASAVAHSYEPARAGAPPR
jgi:hypothetical protein